jgi:hypothetical protein
MDALHLRELARRAIQSGALPRQDPISSWGSWSVGRACGACGEMIATDTAEIGLEFLIGGQRLVCALHPRCWLAWEEVRSGMA